MIRPVESCPHRRAIADISGAVVAECGLLEEILGVGADPWGRVGRGVCECCCRSFPASVQAVNPVLASVLYERADQIAAQGERRAATRPRR